MKAYGQKSVFFIMNFFTDYLFLIIFLPAPFLFFWFIYYSYDKRAREVVEQLPADIDAKYEDVRIWFKGYDMLKKVNAFQINLGQALYTYNLADLYLFGDGLVVVGKVKAYGKIRLLPPFVICRAEGLSRLSMVPNAVKYVGMEVYGHDIDIGFKDAGYTNVIKLAIKEAGEDLYEKMHTRGY